MSTDTLNPPVSLVDDFKDLQMTIFQDHDGDKTRQLVAYFREAEIKSREMQLRTTDYEQKRYAQMLADAFAASTRILMAAWHKTHGSDLNV